MRRVDAFEHLADREVDIVHAAEGVVVHRIEADRHAGEPGIAQRARLLRQQGAVGGERDFDRQPRQALDQLFDVLAQQRLAAGDAQLVHAVRDEQRGDAFDLFETEQLGAGQIRVVLVEHAFRHAIDAAEIAPVGDRYPQIAYRAVARVDQPAGGRYRAFGHDRRGARGGAGVQQMYDLFAHGQRGVKFGVANPFDRKAGKRLCMARGWNTNRSPSGWQ